VYTPPSTDTTQLDSTRQDKFSTCSVSKFSSAVYIGHKPTWQPYHWLTAAASTINWSNTVLSPFWQKSRRKTEI